MALLTVCLMGLSAHSLASVLMDTVDVDAEQLVLLYFFFLFLPTLSGGVVDVSAAQAMSRSFSWNLVFVRLQAGW